MMRRLFTHRILGLIFVGMLVLGVWLVNAIFTQKFISYDHVTVSTDTVGLNLPEKADVKARGVIIGEVLDAQPVAHGAVLTLGIKPDKIGLIPSNATASILPKTLFGEKYVALDIPKTSASTVALHAGSHISQTKVPIEVERVLDDIYPLLTTLQPAEINYTLNAIATALEGRGNELGQTIVTLNSYLKKLNPDVPKLIGDLKLLSTVSSNYADVTPEIAATLRNTVKTGNTLVSRQAKLHSFLEQTTAFSGVANQFLTDNGQNIITLGEISAPQAALLAHYSPEFPCLLGGIVRQTPLLSSTFRGFVFHISLDIIPKQPRGYTPSDTQVYGATQGPNCVGLPNTPGVSHTHPIRTMPNFDDGVNNLGRGDGQRTAPRLDKTAKAAPTKAAGTSFVTPNTSNAQQMATIDSLVAPMLGLPYDEVPGVNALLFGPLAAGSEVSVQ